MIDYDEFHDGSLDGFWLEGTAMYVFLRTESEKRFVARANGVKALAATGFRSGNIILDVVMREHSEVTLEDIANLYELAEGPEKANQSERLLADVSRLGLRLLEISPSYGGMCMVLADSIDFMPQDKWAPIRKV